LGLPDLDGFLVARTLREKYNTAGPLLIAQSGYGQAEDVRKAREAGFDLHLTKPVNIDELLSVLQASGQ
jgi:CheY-like chemotaxis protein